VFETPLSDGCGAACDDTHGLTSSDVPCRLHCFWAGRMMRLPWGVLGQDKMFFPEHSEESGAVERFGA
jgi:hypothetical protein